MSEKETRWGIIGCGDVTEVKSGPAFNNVDGSELVAVMRRDGDKARDYAERHKVARWYNDAGQLMNDPDINAVYIATPPSSHKAYAIEALRRGLDVYVEKPVALNATEAKEIALALQGSTGKLVAAHYRRALPMYSYVKQLLDVHAIGDVRTVQVRIWQESKPRLVADSRDNWRIDPSVSGGGYFHDIAPHQLDLMLYFFGMPLKTHGFSLNQAGQGPADDHVTGLALFPNNISFHGSWSFNVNEKDQADECVIMGGGGSIRFPFFGNSITWHSDEKEGVQVAGFEHPAHIQQPMIERTVRYFRGTGENPCPASDAVTIMKLMDAFTGK